MPSSFVRLSGAQVVEGILGMTGTVALMVSALTSHWYNSKGLWESDPMSDQNGATNLTTANPTSRVREAQLFFTGLSFVMAAASFCICLVILFCWKPPLHNQDTRRTPKPGSLLLAVLLPTGLFLLVGWILFTWQRWEDIRSHWTFLGYSYWLGALAWTILLVIYPASYLRNECSLAEGQKPIEV
ncbi:uncharacterized protein O3C94_021679 [Discoglossus pictus]